MILLLMCFLDLSMQLNEGLFAMNGHCGYVLKPACMTDASFSPFEKHTLRDVDPLTISLTVRFCLHPEFSIQPLSCYELCIPQCGAFIINILTYFLH